MKAACLLIAGITGLTVSLTQAQVGSIAFADAGSPSVSPGLSINSATNFHLGNLVSTRVSTGYFSGFGVAQFGSVNFSPAVGGSFSFSNPGFGSFNSTAIFDGPASPGALTYYIYGLYTSGNSGAFSQALNNQPATFTINFTQSPAGTGTISDSAMFAIPPVVTPEPGTLALMGAGAAALGLSLRCRKA